MVLCANSSVYRVQSPARIARAFAHSTTDDDATTTRRRAMAKKTVKAGMNTSRDGLVDMGTVPGTMKTLVRATNGWIGESRHRDRAEGGGGVGDARGE